MVRLPVRLVGVLSVLVFLVVFAPVPGVATAAAQPRDGLDRSILRAFQEGEALFENLQQTQALELFSQVVDALMPTARAGTLSEAERDVLLESLSYRARAGFNVGQTDVVERDLDTAIRLNPGFACGPRLISPGLVETCERLRSDLVGRLELVVSPPDAVVEVDGRSVDLGVGPMEIIAGSHTVSVNRAGYAGASASVDVEAGDTPTLHEVALERVSAVLRILTRPPGATVHVNTIQYGPTEGTARAGRGRPGQIEGHPIREFSDELTVPGLRPGLVSVVVTLEGYRTVRNDLDLDEPADYPAHFVLERAEGTVTFDGLPAGSTVEVGRQGESDLAVVDLQDGRITLPIGVYDVAVAHPEAGYYDDTATVIDRQEYQMPVRLRPSVTVLGILGDDTVGRDAVIRAFDRAFVGLDGWTYQNRSEAGASLLDDAGLTADRLRRLVNPRVVQEQPIDWEAVQDVSSREGRSSVYVVGVLDNDLSATYADLWMWRSAPAPALPARLRVGLSAGDGRAVDTELPRAFADVPLERAWLGALLIDADAERGPFVARVTAGGPAQQAGLEPGDVIVSVDGVGTDRVALVHDSLADSAGGRVTLGVERGGGRQDIEVTLGAGPRVARRDNRDMAYPAVAASVSASRVRDPMAHPDWVWELNEAATRLQAGDLEGALDLLRRAERFVTTGAGVGRGTVDYWLGMAYTIAGPQFRAQAQQSFERAAEDPEARLVHNDGPWVAPRARARLAELTGGGPTSR